MDRNVLVAAALAIALNGMAVLLHLGYQGSVVLVFGGMTLYYAFDGRGALSRNDWKLFAGFFLFSNVCTLGLEVLMMHFDVWGFTCRTHRLVGLTFLGAPIEEYEYWATCAAIVPLSYLVFGRKLKPGLADEPLLLVRLAKWADSLHLRAKIDAIPYVEDTEGEVGQFARGARFPVYICVQLAILAAIIALVRRYHGSWKALVATVLVFFLTAFPNEFYSIRQGYWTYNSHKMIGIYILHIPLEAWLMYYLPAVLACMMMDVADRDVFGRDL